VSRSKEPTLRASRNFQDTGAVAAGIAKYAGPLAHPDDRGFRHLSLEEKLEWRMPPLSELAPARLSVLNRVWLIILRAYLVVAVALVIYKVTLLALHAA
jgi:hypothetical protein